MTTSVLVAGATGAIGQQLVPLLRDAGYRVFGTTRSRDRAEALSAAGVEPVILDVFDQAAVEMSFSSIRPECLVHMLTDLPKDLSPEAMVEGRVRNARIWSEGTPILMNAAQRAGTRRAIAQSLAWLYAPGREPHEEEDPLAAADPETKIALDAVGALESAVLGAAPVEGIVLRYGLLYGPGTSSDRPHGPCPLHVQAAAHAALLASMKGRAGVYNVTDDNPLVSSRKAREQLAWHPALRRAK